MKYSRIKKEDVPRMHLIGNGDPLVGKRLLSFSDRSYDHTFEGERYVLGEWWIGRNEEGVYGIIAGGMKNIECFMNWVLNIGHYCFNPIDIKDYVWSRANNAYVSKNLVGSLQEIPLVVGGHYVFVPHYEASEVKKIIYKRSFMDEQTVWSKKT